MSLLLVAWLSAASAAASTPTFDTHCRPGETAVLNAHMRRVLPAGGGDTDLQDNGKLLSLCADRPAEPFERLVYRYGRPGKVEFEKAATRASPFGVFSEATTPHTGEDSLMFTADTARFRISIATGQGSGVFVVVHRGGKVVADLFSGNEEGVDFERGPASFDAQGPSSPIFVRRATDGF